MASGIKVTCTVTDVVTSEVENYLKERLKEAGRKAAGKIRDEMYTFALTTIAYFYSSYSPTYYRRHGNFAIPPFKKYYQNSHNIVFSGGIELTPDVIPDVYRERRILSADLDSPLEVFQRVIMEGMHGVGGPRTDIPYERFEEKRDMIKAHIIDYIDF